MTTTGKLSSAPARPSGAAPASPSGAGQQEFEENARNSNHNLFWMAAQQVVLRIGWVFKTESVIIPAFFDFISGSASASVVRSVLPVLNRLGQSVPPLLYADRLQSLRHKKAALVAFSFLMAAPFLTLACLSFAASAHGGGWLVPVCMALYAVFFCFGGLTNLAFSTLQGKLIIPTLRGRLMAISSFLGAVGSVLCAWWLMRRWLELPGGGFGYLFAFTGGCFLLSATCSLMVRESADARLPSKRSTRRARLGAAWMIVRNDGNFRRLAMVALLFSTALMLFPHYQALAREKLGLQGKNLMYWVIMQNVSIGVFGLLIGPLADRRGNRLTLSLVILLSAITPALAVALAYGDPEIGKHWFWVVFAPLGMTPVSMRTMNNYTLEICPAHDHPRYLSTLSLCLAAPFCLSPLVGVLIDAVGFAAVFLGVAGAMLCCGLLTFRLVEPRHQRPAAEAAPVLPDE